VIKTSHNYYKSIPMSHFMTISIFILISFSCLAQNEELNKQLEALQIKNYDRSLNTDSLCHIIGKTLVKKLTENRIVEADNIPLLERLESDDKQINIYTFKYYSGGSAGMNSSAVIQWTKTDGSYGAYELFPADKKGFAGVFSNFYSIQKLESDKDLYLLIGREGYSGSVNGGIALLVRIKGDYLILDHPAFYDESPILLFRDNHSGGEGFCKACIEYDEETKTLRVKNVGEEDKIDIRPYIKFKNVFRDKELEEWVLQFDGNRFVEK